MAFIIALNFYSALTFIQIIKLHWIHFIHKLFIIGLISFKCRDAGFNLKVPPQRGAVGLLKAGIIFPFLFYFTFFFFQVCWVPICSHCIQRKNIAQRGGESQDHIFMAEVCSKVTEANETN